MISVEIAYNPLTRVNYAVKLGIYLPTLTRVVAEALSADMGMIMHGALAMNALDPRIIPDDMTSVESTAGAGLDLDIRVYVSEAVGLQDADHPAFTAHFRQFIQTWLSARVKDRFPAVSVRVAQIPE